MNIFWDTNILIDLLTDAREHHLVALKLFENQKLQNFKIFITPLSLANAEYILAAHHKLRDFVYRISKINEYYKVCDMNQQQADLALKSRWPDFEDALQYQSAIAAGCNVIITRDFKGFEQSLIPIFSPEQFLEKHPHAT